MFQYAKCFEETYTKAISQHTKAYGLRNERFWRTLRGTFWKNITASTGCQRTFTLKKSGRN